METIAVDTGTTTTFRGVVMPHGPRTDEVSAIVLLERLQGRPLSEVKFWGNPECPIEQIKEFLTEGLLPVEIGDFSYQIAGVRSAAEATLQTLGYEQGSLTSGQLALLEMLAQRNQNGYMNQFYMSLPRILKDVYDLPEYDEMDVMNRFKDIVHAFLDYEDRPEGSNLTQIREELQDLAKATQKCQNAPFTPGRYLRDLCYRGESTEQIREKVKFWINAWDHWQREFRNARTDWPKTQKLRFSVLGLPAAAVETTNKFLAKVCFGKDQPDRIDIFVGRNPETGHAVIMTKRKNVSALYQELERLEPGRWYRHESAGNIINGGPLYPEVTPTSLPLSELAGLVSKYPPR